MYDSIPKLYVLFKRALLHVQITICFIFLGTCQWQDDTYTATFELRTMAESQGFNHFCFFFLFFPHPPPPPPPHLFVIKLSILGFLVLVHIKAGEEHTVIQCWNQGNKHKVFRNDSTMSMNCSTVKYGNTKTFPDESQCNSERP